MRFNRLDLNLIVALDALLVERNVTRAATRLNLSQSATSNALARLRDYFGDELLVRVGRQMELTPRSIALREAVRDVLLRVDATLAVLPLFDEAASDRSFKLFVSDYTMLTLAPHLLACAAQRAPRVRFEFLPQVDQPQRALERGEVDLLVIPQAHCSPDHPTEPLFDEDFCCVVWEKSRLARGEFTRERYLAAGHVMVQAETGQMAFERWLLKRHGVSRRMEVSTFGFVPPIFLLVGTERVATVHSRLARRFAPVQPVKVLTPPFEMPRMVQAVQWHKYHSTDPGLVWLRQTMHEAVRRMDAPLPAESEPTAKPLDRAGQMPLRKSTATDADVVAGVEGPK